MPAALAIPALISAGGQVASSVIASKSAKKAARTQTTAANVAGQRQDRATQDALRYIEARRLGLPEPASPYPPGGASLGFGSQLAPTGTKPPMPVPGGGYGGAPPPGGPLSLGMATQGQQGQMVTVQAPDGSETRQMPADQAQRYVQRGARIL